MAIRADGKTPIATCRRTRHAILFGARFAIWVRYSSGVRFSTNLGRSNSQSRRSFSFRTVLVSGGSPNPFTQNSRPSDVFFLSMATGRRINGARDVFDELLSVYSRNANAALSTLMPVSWIQVRRFVIKALRRRSSMSGSKRVWISLSICRPSSCLSAASGRS